MFAITVSAEFYSGTCGDNVSWSLNTSSGVLTISGTGKMKNYTVTRDPPWNSYRSDIKTVDIKYGLTSIGEWAFDNCSNLTKVTIPNSVTQIGEFAFYKCSSLTSAKIPDSVISIDNSAFRDCSSLTQINIPIGITSIGDYTFQHCESLTTVTIGNNVSSIGYDAFYHCDSLTNITIPASVSVVESWAFAYCENLSSVTFLTENVTFEYSVFAACSKLNTIRLYRNSTADSYFDDDDYTKVYLDDITYTVSYNANGGSGAPATQVKKYGKTLTLSNTIPTKSDYTFKGWATRADGGVVYSAGESYTANANVTLYAVWELNTYKVTYNANGGTRQPSAQTKTHNIDLTLSSSIPTRTGYTFLGWATNSNGDVVYSPGGIYTLNADITLYAVWAINTFTISYDANGGSGTPDAQIKTYGQSLTITSVIPVKEGYTFLGWATDSDGSGTLYSPGDSFKINADTTLYAVWEVTTYKITYFISEENTKTDVKFHWYDYIIYTEIPTLKGYIFQGWATEVNGEIVYAPGDTYSTNEELNLYAIWEKILYCDINNDGAINAKDAVLLAQLLANWDVQFNENAADCNGDGEINSIDAVLLAQFLAGWDVTLG